MLAIWYGNETGSAPGLGPRLKRAQLGPSTYTIAMKGPDKVGVFVGDVGHGRFVPTRPWEVKSPGKKPVL